MRLIDADALEKELEKMTQDFLDDKTIQGNFCAGVTVEMLEEVRKAPTIDAVSVVHGHWLTTEHDSVKCSICGSNEDVWWADTGTNFCPNCGAKMDEVSDNGT